MESKKESRRRYSNWLPYSIAAPFLLLVVLLSLGNPVNATLGSPSSATLSVLDDDGTPSVFFGSDTYFVDEGAGSAAIQIGLSGPWGLPISVEFATSDGTANAPDDYTATNETLTFNPGQTNQSLSVPVIFDAKDEQLLETVNLTLSNPIGATLGSPSSATLNIVEMSKDTDHAYLPVVANYYVEPPNSPPNSPSNPSPSDGAHTIRSISFFLAWTGGDPDGDDVFYDVYFEVDDPTPDVLVCNDTTTTYCDPGPFPTDPITEKYWKVVATDEHGATRRGPIWSFTTLHVLP